MKIITLCGSLKFQKEMMEIAEKVALDGNCILTPVYPVLDNIKRTEEQLVKLKEAHFKRIELSDAILVINVNNYIPVAETVYEIILFRLCVALFSCIFSQLR